MVRLYSPFTVAVPFYGRRLHHTDRTSMFYKTDEPHGLPHDPLKSCVVPRPIGWISSLAADGTVNLAPFSFFNLLCSEPPMVMFAANGKHPHGHKDSIVNVEATGEFVCSMATWDLRQHVKETSAPVLPDTNEFELAGLETEPSELVKPPGSRHPQSTLNVGITRPWICRVILKTDATPSASGMLSAYISGTRRSPTA